MKQLIFALFLPALALLFSYMPVFGEEQNIYDADSINQDSEVIIYNVGKFRKLPAFRLSAGLGYGERLSYTLENDPVRKDMIDGLIYEASFAYFFNDKHGARIIYSGFSASSGKSEMDSESQLNNIGAEYVFRINPDIHNLLINMSLGLGYADYKTSYSGKSYFLEEKGSTLGFSFAIDLDYMLTQNLALGTTISGNFGTVKTVHLKNDDRQWNYKFDSGGVRLNRMNLLLGLRYYF